MTAFTSLCLLSGCSSHSLITFILFLTGSAKMNKCVFQSLCFMSSNTAICSISTLEIESTSELAMCHWIDPEELRLAIDVHLKISTHVLGTKLVDEMLFLNDNLKMKSKDSSSTFAKRNLQKKILALIIGRWLDSDDLEVIHQKFQIFWPSVENRKWSIQRQGNSRPHA